MSVGVFPPPAAPDKLVISPFSACSLGVELAAFATAAPASATWPTTNKAFYYPFTISQGLTVTKMWAINGAAVSGNVDIGIYNAAGARLVSKGSTAQSGTNAMQVFDVTDTVLGPGLYFLALNMDNTTGTFILSIVAGFADLAMGWYTQAVGAVTLPATATFASSTSGIVPLFGLEANTVY